MQTSSPSLRHSGLGIASFVVSLAAGALMLLFFVLAGMMAIAQPDGIDEKSPEAIVLGLLLMATLLVELVALGLGIGGLAQAGCKKIFAVLGTVFSAAIFLSGLGLILIGLAAD